MHGLIIYMLFNSISVMIELRKSDYEGLSEVLFKSAKNFVSSVSQT